MTYSLLFSRDMIKQALLLHFILKKPFSAPNLNLESGGVRVGRSVHARTAYCLIPEIPFKFFIHVFSLHSSRLPKFEKNEKKIFSASKNCLNLSDHCIRNEFVVILGKLILRVYLNEFFLAPPVTLA